MITTNKNNKNHHTRKEVFYSNIVQGLLLSQLCTQLCTSFFGGGFMMNVYGLIASTLYLLCKLFMFDATDREVYLDDERIAGIILGSIVGECILVF